MKHQLLALFLAITTPAAFADGDHDHSHEHDHHHAAKKGPNGGTILDKVTPHIEVSVTENRLVRITFLDEKGKAIPAGDQTLTAVGGSRTNPTRLAFAKGEGDESGSLISDKPLPEGDHIPLVLRIVPAPGEKPVTARITLHLHD